MKNIIFKNKFSINTHNEEVEKIYNDNVNSRLIRFTKYVIFVALSINIFELIYLYNISSSEENLKWTIIFTYVSIANLSLMFILNVTSWITHSVKIMKSVVIIIYILSVITFNTIDLGFTLFSVSCLYSKFMFYINF